MRKRLRACLLILALCLPAAACAPAGGAQSLAPSPSAPGQSLPAVLSPGGASPWETISPSPGNSPDGRPSPLPSDLPALSPPPSALPPDPSPSPQPVVTVAVRGPDAVWLMEDTEIPFTPGMTAMDALSAACEARELELSVRGSGRTAYVKGIGGVSERAHGPLSGWVYKVSGVYMSVGLGSAELAEGDRVALYYTLDLGEDIKKETD